MFILAAIVVAVPIKRAKAAALASKTIFLIPSSRS
jgi:hypothetical protein